jgi:hypothetical protein
LWLIRVVSHADARGQPILWLSANVPCPITSQPLPSISLVTTGPQTQDTQLYNNYGAKPNEEFLLGYGFVLSPNPDDTVILKLGFPSLSPAIQSAFSQKALDPAKRFALRRDGEIDKDLLEVLRVVISGGEEEMQVDEEDEHGLHEKEEKEMQLEMDVLGTVGQMLEDKLAKLEHGPPEGLVDVREDVRAMCNVYRQGGLGPASDTGYATVRRADHCSRPSGDHQCCAGQARDEDGAVGEAHRSGYGRVQLLRMSMSMSMYCLICGPPAELLTQRLKARQLHRSVPPERGCPERV